jgi:hypothetical protein
VGQRHALPSAVEAFFWQRMAPPHNRAELVLAAVAHWVNEHYSGILYTTLYRCFSLDASTIPE